MKLNKLVIIFIAAVFAIGTAQAQDKRTVKTKVADILMFLPAQDDTQAQRLFKEIMSLGDEGIDMIADQVQANGVAAAVPYRFAVSLLTHYATSPTDKAQIEKIYLATLSQVQVTEVKAYFLDNLKWVASNTSVEPLALLINDKDLSDPAIAVLEIVGTNPAKNAMLKSLASAPPFAQARLLQALGHLKYQQALPAITAAIASPDLNTKRSALWALALIGNPSSSEVLLNDVKSAGWKNDRSGSFNALTEYIHNYTGDEKSLTKITKTILANTLAPTQQHFRLAALGIWAGLQHGNETKTLIKELRRFDGEYRKEVLNIAGSRMMGGDGIGRWNAEFQKSKGEEQADIFTALAKAYNRGNVWPDEHILPALSNENPLVRMAAAKGLADVKDKNYAEALTGYLLRTSDDAELAVAKGQLLRVINKDNTNLLSDKAGSASPKVKVIILQILAERRAVAAFPVVLTLTSDADASVKSEALKSLPFVSSPDNTNELLSKLSAASDAGEITAYQSAIIAGMNSQTIAAINGVYATQKLKLIPVLPYLNDKAALDKVSELFYKGSESDREAAFTALLNWQNGDAVRTLIAIRKDENLKKYHAKAFAAALPQTAKSALPDDEKLLLLRDLLTLADNKDDKISVLRTMGSVRTFLSLVVVADFIDDAELGAAATRAAMQIILPTADAKPGMTGAFVRHTLERMRQKLSGEDSQYEVIDIDSYVAKLPFTKGYTSIFNGKDLTGWQGLVENPVARAKMSAEILAKKQIEANAKVSKNWSVRNGMIVFQGDGANLSTTRPYGDFEMIVDWRISRNGDSGIYLRGSPQIQIWDIARIDVGAQVGSGGLYNNQKEKSSPLVVADNPVGEWNTFRIIMKGEKVTVFLNGILVVDNVTLENYWDRTIPIFPSESIELQAHGTDLAFRNIYVNEIGGSTVSDINDDEKKDGYVSLFNGKDLDQWTGNKTEYVVEEGTIAYYTNKEAHGNLNSAKEYSDFVFRFEFQLTPSANNGIGIHAPETGDAAYLGKEVQVLDDTAPIYEKLEPWQYHGSVYGIIAAKKGFQKPLGEWNKEEIYVKGDYIKVTLNGGVITEGDLKKITANGTLDHKDHPGLLSHKGHIEFLGHGSTVRFRNIRVKEL